MNLKPEQESLIKRILNVFETGTPDGDYAAISIYPDGPHGMRQITYGRSQTTEFGNLGELVRRYVDAGGTYAEGLRPYLDDVGDVPLVDDETFKQLLRDAGRNDPVMQQVQDQFFDDRYFDPAMAWADANGFTLPLSALVIYDSFIHSGGILKFLRRRFPEVPPANGGDERAWITAYVRTRHAWLSDHPNPPVRSSRYRTRDLFREIGAGNWDLAALPFLANGTQVYPQV
jgi:chitosanase